jgi:ABC-type antimicrobial peptide transport system permease subunit
MRLTQPLEEVRSDVRLAMRQLISAPGFTLVAVLTLALGIGVNGAIFSLADAALDVDPLDPLTFVSVPFVILLTAIVAAAVPAWRASRINPVEAFRHGG